MKEDIFSSSQLGANEITFKHNGRTYRLNYHGNMSKHEVRRFAEWADSPAGIAFIHDAHHEIVTGLERRRVLTKKPAQISGYALGQWVRFIYGHSYTRSDGVHRPTARHRSPHGRDIGTARHCDGGRSGGVREYAP